MHYVRTVFLHAVTYHGLYMSSLCFILVDSMRKLLFVLIVVLAIGVMAYPTVDLSHDMFADMTPHMHMNLFGMYLFTHIISSVYCYVVTCSIRYLTSSSCLLQVASHFSFPLPILSRSLLLTPHNHQPTQLTSSFLSLSLLPLSLSLSHSPLYS